MYTWILVFLLCSWSMETLFLKWKYQSYRLCSFKCASLLVFFLKLTVQFATPPGPPQSKAPDKRIVKYLISFNFGILACDLRFVAF